MKKESQTHTIVPPQSLSPDVLRSVCEEFASRDGTDYGLVEKSLEEKTARLESMIDSGEASIVFDAETESVTIVMSRDL